MGKRIDLLWFSCLEFACERMLLVLKEFEVRLFLEWLSLEGAEPRLEM